ncbi:MAG TPA: phosphatase PAP2 family protein [Gaiellales bacterium]
MARARHSASDALAARFTARRAALLIGGYLVGLLGMIYWKGLYLSEDRYFLILLVPALALGVARRYVIDFFPFIALMLAYEELRGVAHLISPHPYYLPQIDIDKMLFNGTIPTVWLQGKLWNGHVQWWQQVLDVLLHLHFIVPPTILFVVWLYDRARYYRFAITILVVSYLGALGFALWPAAPPWMASQHHVIPHIAEIASRISAVQVGGAKVTSHSSYIVGHLTRNASAAVPSLHAAYSFMVILMAFSINRRLGPFGIVYAFAMWFTIVFFGEHYVSDALIGIALAGLVWLGVRRVLPHTWFAGPFPAPIASARGGLRRRST